MDEIIKISSQLIGGEKQQAVDARELWTRLEVKTEYRHWIKRRIEEAQLAEGQDFISRSNLSTSGQTTKEYYITIESGKHIAMLERTEQGKKIRQYFIDVEKEARQLAQKSNLHPLIVQAQQMMDITEKYVAVEEEQKRLAAIQKRQGERIKQIEARQQARLDPAGGFYSVMAYANLKGLRITLAFAQKIGRLAAKLSKELGFPTDKIPDPRFGRVGTYHESVLDDLFDDIGSDKN